MIMLRKRKYFPMQQQQIRFISGMESVYCAVRTVSIEVSVMPPLKRPYHGSGGKSRPLKAEVWFQFEDIPSRICGGTDAEM
jgi:hypothetical protein